MNEFPPMRLERKVTRRPHYLVPLAAQAGANAKLRISSCAYNVIPDGAPRKASGKLQQSLPSLSHLNQDGLHLSVTKSARILVLLTIYIIGRESQDQS